MDYVVENRRRRSLRLRGYNYSQAGAYFVTVCTQGRQSLFGEIIDDQMHMNDAGHMIEHWWHELTNKFPGIETDEYSVMPNHFHGILIIGTTDINPTGAHCDHQHTKSPTLGDIIGWFKTMTTNEYIHGVKQYAWPWFPGRLWQRNYYEHIIRNEEDLSSIREYIMTNPARWALDTENPLSPTP